MHVLTINRPDAFNAINEPLHRMLEEIWRVLREDKKTCGRSWSPAPVRRPFFRQVATWACSTE